MILKQGYLSSCVSNFDFLERHKLRRYDNPNEPLVMFGCYNTQDYNIVKNHKSELIIRWCGKDSLNVNDISIFKNKNIIHVTPLPKVCKLLIYKNIDCKLIKPFLLENPKPLLKGDKIYAYLNRNDPNYYGKLIVDELKKKYSFIIGDLSIPQKDWPRISDSYYSQSYIGLALSNFAGGGGGIVEMGLRGIKVVTNVISLPNTIPWKNIDDIEKAVQEEKYKINTIDTELSNEVKMAMNPNNEGFMYEIIE